VTPLFSTIKYEQPVQLGDGLEANFHDAGHILGASTISLKIGRNGDAVSILFSGDLGRWDKPILQDPTLVDQADYVVVESTYGDRLHDDETTINDALAKVIKATRKAGGNIVIPSFAVERAQEVLYHLNELLMDNRISHLPVFIDSPMAISVTEVFEHHPELFDEEMLKLILRKRSPFDFPGLKMTKTVDESKAINDIEGTAIIIAGSGMCTGGRIKHHLVHNISRPESTILFVGYQAVGTLGRHIVDRTKEVRILGQIHPVTAMVIQIHGFSAHADRDELLRWLSGLQKPLRHVFVTHGEPETAQHFASFVREKRGWETSVPRYGEAVILH